MILFLTSQIGQWGRYAATTLKIFACVSTQVSDDSRRACYVTNNFAQRDSGGRNEYLMSKMTGCIEIS